MRKLLVAGWFVSLAAGLGCFAVWLTLILRNDFDGSFRALLGLVDSVAAMWAFNAGIIATGKRI